MSLGVPTRSGLAAAFAAAAVFAGAAAASPPPLDPLTPDLGHPGYDTVRAEIALDLDIAGGAIRDGRAAIDLVAAEPLAGLAFDLRDGLAVESVAVDGEPARFRHAGDDLAIDLPAPAAAGDAIEIVVRYRGTPGPSDDPYQRGWWADGRTIFTLGEPGGAEAWFPVNNHPSDAALWTLRLTVPDGATALAGGAPGRPVAGDGDRGLTTTWVYDDPVSPYLLAFAAGTFEIVRMAGPGGLPITLALPPDLPPESRAVFTDIPEMIGWFETLFGPYPGRRFGAAVVDGFGGALETEEMVIFGRASLSSRTVAHEIAHHWFGNSVRLESWSDIWLNEAFGRYAEILWTERADGPIARDAALQALADTVARQAAAGAPPVARPTVDSLFGGNTYNRGALMLHALRARLGDDAFFALLREWNARYANQAAGTDEFTALAGAVAGEDLSGFFDLWLYRTEAPDPLLPPLG